MSRSWLSGKVLKVIVGRGTVCLWARPAPLCNLIRECLGRRVRESEGLGGGKDRRTPLEPSASGGTHWLHSWRGERESFPSSHPPSPSLGRREELGEECGGWEARQRFTPIRATQTPHPGRSWSRQEEDLVSPHPTSSPGLPTTAGKRQKGNPGHSRCGQCWEKGQTGTGGTVSGQRGSGAWGARLWGPPVLLPNAFLLE